MKKVLFSFVASLLFVSGWGTVLADTFCPHKQASRTQQKAATVAQQRQGSSCHEEIATERTPTSDASSKELGQTETLTEKQDLCTHCISKPETSTDLFIFTRGTELAGRDAGTPLVIPSGFPLPTSDLFETPIHARQHAPPGASARRHLVLSVFLI